MLLISLTVFMCFFLGGDSHFNLAFDEPSCDESDLKFLNCGQRIAYNYDLVRKGIFDMLACERRNGASIISNPPSDMTAEKLQNLYHATVLLGSKVSRWNTTMQWREMASKTIAYGKMKEGGVEKLKEDLKTGLKQLKPAFDEYEGYIKGLEIGAKSCQIPAIITALVSDFDFSKIDPVDLPKVKKIYKIYEVPHQG